MKKSIIVICGCILFFAGCTEKGPPIILSNVAYTDSSYILSTLPATDPHNVLIEEFTGQSCPNCPAAHTLLGTFVPANRLNILGLYIYGDNQAQPPPGAPQDFQTQNATDINKYIYGGGVPGLGLPCAGIDRVTYSQALLQYAGGWSSSYNQRLNVVDSINLSLTSSFSSSDSNATVIVTITYLQNVSTAQNLSLAVVEDSITGFQEFPAGFNSTNNVDSFYIFNDVFRTLISAEPYGDPILPKIALKQAKLVDQRTYSYKVQAGWNLAHCRVIAFVHYSNSEPMEDVLQSAQTKLTGP